MAKQQTEQRYIFKVHSKRLREAQWDLDLQLHAARLSGEVVSLSDSQMLRWIDELNNAGDVDKYARRIRRQLKLARQCEVSSAVTYEVKRLYDELDETLFKKDYVCVVMDTKKDYQRAVKGFKINGIKFVRLLGTAGGIKTSTIVFVNEELAPALRERIDNGRDKTKELVPAKFEAYRALTCSGSTPVSMPNGVVVVDDCNVVFKADVALLSDECEGEPVMTIQQDADVDLCANDGFGLMLPSLAERWSRELGLKYTAGGMNTRFAWEKGMVFAFDFLEFADTVAGTRIIKDAWGTERDLSEVELILTVSQVKLWDSYNSMEQYLECCAQNHYTFAVTKTSPKRLDNQRNLNYQFIQSYELTDDQIAELVMPTIDEVRDVMGCDWRKAALYLGASEFDSLEELKAMDPTAAALLIQPEMIGDPHIRSRIKKMIKKRIEDAKIGVISVAGNYSILSGDPYALCQSMFGLEVTGLLKGGELYSKYWLDRGVERVVGFRAPMSSHNNIVVLDVCGREDVQHWFQYITTCTILSAWDTTCHALNGADFDGDLIFTTNNSVLLNNHRKTLPLLCVQRKAPKTIPTEENIIASNIAGFGDDIGAITNRVTSMYDVQASFAPGSREYETLAYRIQCGQLFQQNAIDKIKGIVAKPMPAYWYSRRECIEQFDDPDEQAFQLSICAEKKPYFMQYVYQSLRRQYKKRTGVIKHSASYKYGVDPESIMKKDASELTEMESQYVLTFDRESPVTDGDCVMNRLCHFVEDHLDGWRPAGEDADTSALIKNDLLYNRYIKGKVLEQIDKYKDSVEKRSDEMSVKLFFGTDKREETNKSLMVVETVQALSVACTNAKLLCEILIDTCYKSSALRELIWINYGSIIIDTLLEKNGYAANNIFSDDGGEVQFHGVNYSVNLVHRPKEVADESCDG